MHVRRTLVFTALTLIVVGAIRAPRLFEPVREGPAVEDLARSRGAAWGDFDGDGDPDLYVTHPTWDGDETVLENALYRNDDGRLVRVRPGPGGEPGAWEGAVWVDVDNDGDLDLHVVGRAGSGSMLFENDGAGSLIPRSTEVFDRGVRSGSMACWSDVDADGRLDVFIVGYGEGRNALFRGAGDWGFHPVPIPAEAEGDGSARACAWGDLNDDGLPEMVVANARRPNTLLRNHGGMRLVPDTTTALHHDTAYGYGLSWSDVNGDGARDLFVANFDAGNSLYLGDGTGDLDPVTLDESLQSVATKGHVWGDFDLDGREDVYLGSGTPGPAMHNRLYLATGNGTFRPADGGAATADADTSAAAASADYDLDGDLDLYVANWGSTTSVDRLYRNTTDGSAWLKVRLEGVQSNRMAIGARVSVLVGPDGGRRWLHRWLDATTGYAGQNEPIVHFGLGAAAGVDSLVVRWPSGTTSRFGAVDAPAALLIREGAAAPMPPSAHRPGT